MTDRVLRLPMSDALMLRVLDGTLTETRRPTRHGGAGSVVAFTEAHQIWPWGEPGEFAAQVQYRADNAIRYVCPCGDWAPSSLPWRIPRFMPGWASRARATLTEVRQERLHEMTVGAMRREGVLADAPEHVREAAARLGGESVVLGHAWEYMAARWDAIYGRRPGFAWDDNPLIWVHAWGPVEVRRG